MVQKLDSKEVVTTGELTPRNMFHIETMLTNQLYKYFPKKGVTNLI